MTGDATDGVEQGPDPVWERISGTAVRPVLQALPAGFRDEFAAHYRTRPTPADRSVPCFYRRVFVVAHCSTDRGRGDTP